MEGRRGREEALLAERAGREETGQHQSTLVSVVEGVGMVSVGQLPNTRQSLRRRPARRIVTWSAARRQHRSLVAREMRKQ